jgi:uncharacterized ferritin-like protein (DUF455 family)
MANKIMRHFNNMVPVRNDRAGKTHHGRGIILFGAAHLECNEVNRSLPRNYIAKKQCSSFSIREFGIGMQ